MKPNGFQVKPWQMMLYASGSLAVTLSYQAFSTYIQFLYIDRLGLNALWVGAVWSVYGVWNAINDPLSGYWSDRTRTRWGRRIPWMAGSLAPLAISFYLLWSPSRSLTAVPGVPLLVYFAAFVLAFDFLWTIMVMNWTSLFPEMVPDEKQRASVSGWRQIFSVLGLLIGVALPPILAGEDWSGRGVVALVLTIPTFTFFGLAILGSRERAESQHAEPLALWPALRYTFTNRDFLVFIAANLCIQFIFNMLTASVPFYAKYALRIQADVTIGGVRLDVGLQNSLLLGAAFIMALPAMPAWTKLAQRIGAHRALRIAALSSAGALLLLFLPTNFQTGVMATAFFGLNLAGLLMLTDLLVADVVDADELATGLRREGMFFGVNGLMIRLAFTFQGLITGAVLTLTQYIKPSEALLYPEQPAAAIAGMRWMTAGIPAIAALLAGLILSKYTLSGARLKEIQQRIAELHAQKRVP